MPKQKRKQKQPKFVIVLPNNDNRVEFNRKYGNKQVDIHGVRLSDWGMSPGLCRAAVEVVN